ncbi:YdeI/OmpD-associated family protein [Devosia elaeis]|uniref:YdeI/OmpD-associated family protein n=1 Tax=Devosia elaeis TaxID=1770058 RepID=A0A178HVM1_9HYPH|nr:YdeI/OmpD-associated family protein [Devosia elaeis]OAM76056.1 hypothetical protein A3840_13795 [Devosia elaeis]
MSPKLRPLRPRETMPDFVLEALEAHGLIAQYEARPPYQRNDYLLWINKAQREETKQKRLAQMLEELEGGGVYMRMKWNG